MLISWRVYLETCWLCSHKTQQLTEFITNTHGAQTLFFANEDSMGAKAVDVQYVIL